MPEKKATVELDGKMGSLNTTLDSLEKKLDRVKKSLADINRQQADARRLNENLASSGKLSQSDFNENNRRNNLRYEERSLKLQLDQDVIEGKLAQTRKNLARATLELAEANKVGAAANEAVALSEEKVASAQTRTARTAGEKRVRRTRVGDANNAKLLEETSSQLQAEIRLNETVAVKTKELTQVLNTETAAIEELAVATERNNRVANRLENAEKSAPRQRRPGGGPSGGGGNVPPRRTAAGGSERFEEPEYSPGHGIGILRSAYQSGYISQNQYSQYLQGYARRVTANPDQYSPATIDRALRDAGLAGSAGQSARRSAGKYATGRDVATTNLYSATSGINADPEKYNRLLNEYSGRLTTGGLSPEEEIENLRAQTVFTNRLNGVVNARAKKQKREADTLEEVNRKSAYLEVRDTSAEPEFLKQRIQSLTDTYRNVDTEPEARLRAVRETQQLLNRQRIVESRSGRGATDPEADARKLEEVRRRSAYAAVRGTTGEFGFIQNETNRLLDIVQNEDRTADERLGAIKKVQQLTSRYQTIRNQVSTKIKRAGDEKRRNDEDDIRKAEQSRSLNNLRDRVEANIGGRSADYYRSRKSEIQDSLTGDISDRERRSMLNELDRVQNRLTAIDRKSGTSNRGIDSETRKRYESLRTQERALSASHMLGDIQTDDYIGKMSGFLGEYQPGTTDHLRVARNLRNLERRGTKSDASRILRQSELFSNIGSGLGLIGERATYGTTLGLGVGIGGASALSLGYEQDFARVASVMNTKDPDYKQKAAGVKRGLEGLSSQLPTSFKDLADIAATGLNLGVPDEQIVKFTNTIAKLNIGLKELPAKDAAENLAMIANAMGKDVSKNPEFFAKFGTMIAAVDQVSAAKPQTTLNMMGKMAGETTHLGFSDAQLIAWANAMASVKIAPQEGGSAFSRFLQILTKAVMEKGKALTQVANVSGQRTPEQFSQLFQTDASEAVNQFIIGLSKVPKGMGVDRILGSIGVGKGRLDSRYIKDVLTRLSNSSQLYGKYEAVGSGEANTYDTGGKQTLDTRTQIMLATNLSQINILLNKGKLAAKDFGDQIMKSFPNAVPAAEKFLGMMVNLSNAYSRLGPLSTGFVNSVALTVFAFGPVVLGMGRVVSLIAAASRAYGAWKALNTETLGARVSGAIQSTAEPTYLRTKLEDIKASSQAEEQAALKTAEVTEASELRKVEAINKATFAAKEEADAILTIATSSRESEAVVHNGSFMMMADFERTAKAARDVGISEGGIGTAAMTAATEVGKATTEMNAELTTVGTTAEKLPSKLRGIAEGLATIVGGVAKFASAMLIINTALQTGDLLTEGNQKRKEDLNEAQFANYGMDFGGELVNSFKNPGGFLYSLGGQKGNTGTNGTLSGWNDYLNSSEEIIRSSGDPAAFKAYQNMLPRINHAREVWQSTGSIDDKELRGISNIIHTIVDGAKTNRIPGAKAITTPNFGDPSATVANFMGITPRVDELLGMGGRGTKAQNEAGSSYIKRSIIDVGQRLGATPKQILAALETAGVESDFTNLDHGDRVGPDSRGVFQQRAPWGPESSRMNVRDSALRFYMRAMAADRKNPNLTPGQLAQKVQVSAFPGRYDKRQDQALAIMEKYGVSTNGIGTVGEAGVGNPSSDGNAHITALGGPEDRSGINWGLFPENSSAGKPDKAAIDAAAAVEAGVAGKLKITRDKIKNEIKGIDFSNKSAQELADQETSLKKLYDELFAVQMDAARTKLAKEKAEHPANTKAANARFTAAKGVFTSEHTDFLKAVHDKIYLTDADNDQMKAQIQAYKDQKNETADASRIEYLKTQLEHQKGAPLSSLGNTRDLLQQSIESQYYDRGKKSQDEYEKSMAKDSRREAEYSGKRDVDLAEALKEKKTQLKDLELLWLSLNEEALAVLKQQNQQEIALAESKVGGIKSESDRLLLLDQINKMKFESINLEERESIVRAQGNKTLEANARDYATIQRQILNNQITQESYLRKSRQDSGMAEFFRGEAENALTPQIRANALAKAQSYERSSFYLQGGHSSEDEANFNQKQTYERMKNSNDLTMNNFSRSFGFGLTNLNNPGVNGSRIIKDTLGSLLETASKGNSADVQNQAFGKFSDYVKTATNPDIMGGSVLSSQSAIDMISGYKDQLDSQGRLTPDKLSEIQDLAFQIIKLQFDSIISVDPSATGDQKNSLFKSGIKAPIFSASGQNLGLPRTTRSEVHNMGSGYQSEMSKVSGDFWSELLDGSKGISSNLMRNLLNPKDKKNIMKQFWTDLGNIGIDTMSNLFGSLVKSGIGDLTASVFGHKDKKTGVDATTTAANQASKVATVSAQASDVAAQSSQVIEKSAKGTAEGVKSSASSASKSLMQAAQVMSILASSTQGSQKQKKGGLFGTLLGGIVGSFLPGGWLAGSQIGGMAGNLLGSFDDPRNDALARQSSAGILKSGWDFGRESARGTEDFLRTNMAAMGLRGAEGPNNPSFVESATRAFSMHVPRYSPVAPNIPSVDTNSIANQSVNHYNSGGNITVDARYINPVFNSGADIDKHNENFARRLEQLTKTH